MKPRNPGFRRSAARLVCAWLCCALVWPALSSLPVWAQAELARKVKTRVAPEYPALAQRMHLSGTVKLYVVVSANGSVTNSKAVGGNPVLVDAALDAMKKWKFEPSAEESTGTVEFKFEAPH